MEPIAACLALGDRLSWKMNDKYLVRHRSTSSPAVEKGLLHRPTARHSYGFSFFLLSRFSKMLFPGGNFSAFVLQSSVAQGHSASCTRCLP